MSHTDSQAMFGSVSRRAFVGAGALGAATLALGGGLKPLATSKALADEAASKETYGYTSCSMCNQTPFCGLRGTLKDGKIVRVDGNPDHPKNKPCLKGLTSLQALYDPNRLLYPIKRTNPEKGPDTDPGWERISWDEALDTIAQKFNEAKEKYGVESVTFSAGDPKEHLPVFDRLAALFGTPNVCYGDAQCAMSMFMGGFTTFGRDCTTIPTPQTKVQILWGCNPAWSQYPWPTAYRDMLDYKEAGCKYIVVDTRHTTTAVQLADVFLQPRTGTDGALALAIGNVLIEEDLYSHEFVENWTTGFEEYKELVAEYTPEKAEEITWVPADKIREAARLWAQSGPGAIWLAAHSVSHHTNGLQNNRAILLLDALMGYWDEEGCATAQPARIGTDQNAFKMNDKLTENAPNRAGVDRWPVWSVFENHYQNNGLVEYINDGIIHAGLFVGTNLMLFPQTPLYQEAISSLDFSVAIDLHVNPWTHNCMDMVLPTCVCWERMAPYQAQGNGLFWNEVVVPPAGEAHEDWKILLDIGCRLGFEEECFGGDVEAALQGMLESAGSDAKIEDVRAAVPGIYELPLAGEWRPRQYEETGFGTPSGKVEFVSGIMEQCGFDGLPSYSEPHISPMATPELTEDYPLILGTGSRIPWYVHSKYRHTPWLKQFMPDPVVFMSPEDAEERGLAEGDDVRLFNQFGELKVKAGITNMCRPGIVEFHHGWEQANSCLLIDREFDPTNGFPTFKDGVCQVEKA